MGQSTVLNRALPWHRSPRVGLCLGRPARNRVLVLPNKLKCGGAVTRNGRTTSIGPDGRTTFMGRVARGRTTPMGSVTRGRAATMGTGSRSAPNHLKRPLSS